MTMDTWNEAMLDPDSDSLDLSSLNGSFDLNSTLAYTYSRFGQNPYPLLLLQINKTTLIDKVKICILCSFTIILPVT